MVDARSVQKLGESNGARAPRGSTRDDVFRPIVASKAAFEVADQITFAILSGWYEVGDRLPTVPRLAKAMRVSAPIVGDAVRLLREAGVLQVKRGSGGGITVASADVPTSVTKLSRPRRASSLRVVVEARRPVEVEIARLATVRATEEDFAEMQQLNARLKAARGKARPWTQAHNAFHYTMGRAAGSELLAYFQHEILEEIALMYNNFSERFMYSERTIREHRDTLAALRTRDPEVAARVMEQHLVEFEELAAQFDARPKRRRKRSVRG